MKLEIIKNEKDTLEFFIEGERHTLTNLLKETLSKNNDVEFVAYKLDHPIDQKARFILKAKNPKKALISAIDEIQKQINTFKTEFEKA
jgi:DNA-directed RNA polymerase subunit L